jgi:hypothetical protein
MNTLVEAPLHQAETGGACRRDIRGAGRAFHFSPSQGGPAPLWQRAKIQAIGFRHDDLERTHWKKVWRSIFAD